MARTVRWAEAATQDLAEAAEFSARDSRFYAMALVREARAAARSLRTLAERGRVVPEAHSPEPLKPEGARLPRVTWGLRGESAMGEMVSM